MRRSEFILAASFVMGFMIMAVFVWLGDWREAWREAWGWLRANVLLG
jgi:hypothetical protein